MTPWRRNGGGTRESTPTDSIAVIKNGYFDERKIESDLGFTIKMNGVDLG